MTRDVLGRVCQLLRFAFFGLHKRSILLSRPYSVGRKAPLLTSDSPLGHIEPLNQLFSVTIS